MKHLWPFILMSILTWGPYVPCMHAAGKLLKSPARSYLMVCVAYFVVGLCTMGWMWYKDINPFVWDAKGSPVAFLGGVLGALGALGIVLGVITAFEKGVSPLPIAPTVFCGAPIVATLIGMWLHPPSQSTHPAFYLGMILAASGTGLVMFFAPK